MSPSTFHLAGGVRTAHVSVIADALAKIPRTRLRLTDEIELAGENFQLAIYPSRPGEFLVGGNLQASYEDAREVAQQLSSALAAAELVHELELSPGRGALDERFAHPDFWKPSPEPAQLAPPISAEIEIGERLHAGSADEVWRGSWHRQAVLLTYTGSHPESYAQLRARIALDIEGIEPLLFCGPSGSQEPYPDLLVERLPRGRPLLDVAPLDEPQLAGVGAHVASIAAAAHAAGARLGGIRPELVYVDDAGSLAGIVPRGPTFIMAAPIARGLRSYRTPYLSPEELLARTATITSDVYSLCATLWYAATKLHPCGDPQDVSGLVARMATGQLGDWPGSPALGEALKRGLALDPATRPTATQLAAQLQSLA